MKSSEFIESKYLNAKSAGPLNGKTLTIYDIKAETIRDVRKLLIGFEGVEKSLVVNRTNNEILTEAFGEETDAWKLRKVVLGIVRVRFDGKLTPSIELTPVTTEPEPIVSPEHDQPIPPKESTGKKKR